MVLLIRNCFGYQSQSLQLLCKMILKMTFSAWKQWFGFILAEVGLCDLENGTFDPYLFWFFSHKVRNYSEGFENDYLDQYLLLSQS
jgi:hypothetical protein